MQWEESSATSVASLPKVPKLHHEKTPDSPNWGIFYKMTAPVTFKSVKVVKTKWRLKNYSDKETTRFKAWFQMSPFAVKNITSETQENGVWGLESILPAVL